MFLKIIIKRNVLNLLAVVNCIKFSLNVLINGCRQKLCVINS